MVRRVRRRRGAGRYDDPKDFSDVLGPLRRYLHKQVGRPWNKIWSEITQTLDSRSLTGLHIFDHIRWEVEQKAWIGEDGRRTASGNGVPSCQWTDSTSIPSRDFCAPRRTDDSGFAEGHFWMHRRRSEHLDCRQRTLRTFGVTGWTACVSGSAGIAAGSFTPTGVYPSS